MKKVSTFAERLKVYRRESGRTLRELELVTGVPAQTLNRYELGKRVPKVDVAGKIASLLGVDALWLQGYDVTIKGEPVDANVLPFFLPQNSISIPVLGSIPAGVPVECVQDILEWIDISADMTRGNRECFGLVVKGDSMFPEYVEGDIVIVRQQATCENGDDCVIIINDHEATLKRVHVLEDGIELEAVNRMYGKKKYNIDEVKILPVTILGVVVEQRRKRK